MSAEYKNMTEADIKKEIKGLNVVKSKMTNAKVLESADKKIKALQAELDSRSGAAEDEKKAEEAAKKAEAAKKKKEAEEAKKADTAKKTTTAKQTTAGKKTTSTKKKASVEQFELKIDGKVYKFKDLKSKEECARAIEAVKARREEQVEHQAAREAGKKAARTIPVTRRISDSFVSVTKKAVSEAKKQDRPIDQVKKDVDAVEAAFKKLFDSLERLMGKKIPATQRKAVMDILGDFESKVASDAKKETAKGKKKEDGGLADSSVSVDDGTHGWSYLDLMKF